MHVVYTQSAMYFMGGLSEDKPKALYDKSYEFFKQQDGYFVRTKVIKTE